MSTSTFKPRVGVENVFKALGKGGQGSGQAGQSAASGQAQNRANAADLSRTATRQASPLLSFDLQASLLAYVQMMLGSVPGLKALLLDGQSATALTCVASQSQLVQSQVVLTERYDQFAPAVLAETGGETAHLPAVLVVQPEIAYMPALTALLASTRYRVYHVFTIALSNTTWLEALAEADIHGRVRSVTELYMDLRCLEPQLFHTRNSLAENAQNPALKQQLAMLSPAALVATRDNSAAICALLALHIRPVIRFAAGSRAERAAADINHAFRTHAELFEHGTSLAEPCLLLVLDHADDAITPLLSVWSYHAMIHELLGIEDNVVDMSYTDYTAPGSTPEKPLKSIVLGTSVDSFDHAHRFVNFGDLGVALKKLVVKYTEAHNKQAKLDTLEDIQRCMETLSDFRAEQSEVARHMALFSALNTAIKSRKLLEVSALEQELACGTQQHQDVLNRLMEMIQSNKYDYVDKVRVLGLYALRFESHPATAWQQAKTILAQQATNEHDKIFVNVVDQLLRYGGVSARKSDLFKEQVSVRGLLHAVKTTVGGVDNIYTQHKPLLVETLTAAASGDLKTTTHPFIDPAASSTAKQKYRHIVVYILGGATYQESAACDELSRKLGIRIILGGSTMLRSNQFMHSLLPLPDTIVSVPIPMALAV